MLYFNLLCMHVQWTFNCDRMIDLSTKDKGHSPKKYFPNLLCMHVMYDLYISGPSIVIV